MSRNAQEILCEGWLTKSPPSKRIWRGRWRRRWFTLHSGDLPRQFVLSYYTDRNSRKLKGVIDLDQCEQVDTGLKFEDKKLKFEHMFDIKTQTRTYYLAADTEIEMKSWVKYICDICCLKATCDEEDIKIEEQQQQQIAIDDVVSESPPSSPVSTDPYIMISECTTGKMPVLLQNQPIKDFNTLLQQNVKSSFFRASSRIHNNESYECVTPTYLNCDPKFYDTPRNLQAPPRTTNLSQSGDESFNFYKNIHFSPQSPTDSESVFTDDDWTHNTSQSDQSNIHPRRSNSSADVEVPNQKINKLSIDSIPIPEVSSVAPPRPPKPSHITTSSYHNLQSTRTSKDDVSRSGNHSKSNSTSEEVNMQNLITDETYDFPRSHVDKADVRSTLSRRHCYNNAAPSSIDGQVFTYDTSPKPSTSSAQVFRYGDDVSDEPASPASQSSLPAQYSNLPSPLLFPDTQLMPPPKVNRGLKPKRKLSDSHSISSNTEPASPQFAPSVDRKLKPHSGTLPTPSKMGGFYENGKNRKFRAAPSPTQSSLGRSYESLLVDSDCLFDEIYIEHPFLNKLNKRKMLEYLDLDLENKNNSRHSTHSSVEPLRSPGAITVYKKVDFMKTKAFNKTKELREQRIKEGLP